jgi:hypothetical protein
LIEVGVELQNLFAWLLARSPVATGFATALAQKLLVNLAVSMVFTFAVPLMGICLLVESGKAS